MGAIQHEQHRLQQQQRCDHGIEQHLAGPESILDRNDRLDDRGDSFDQLV